MKPLLLIARTALTKLVVVTTSNLRHPILARSTSWRRRQSAELL